MTELGLTSGQWLLLCAVGAVAGADDTSWLQVMVSRPVVAAAAAGAVVGDVASGLLAGAVLELMVLPYPPMGAARTPDPGVAGVVGGAACAAVGGGTGALAGAVLAGWAAGWLGQWTVRSLRNLNGRLTGRPEELAGDPSALESRQRWGVRLDLLRGALVTAALVLPAASAASLAAGVPVASAGWAVLAVAGLGAGAGATSRVLSTGRWSPGWLVGGLAAGVALAVLAGA